MSIYLVPFQNTHKQSSNRSLHRPHFYLDFSCDRTRGHDDGVVLKNGVDNARRNRGTALNECSETVDCSGKEKEITALH
jgi:hypothetical protein